MPDGKHWVIGTVIDAQGKDVNAKALHNAVQKPMGQEFWTDLERTHWIGDGKPDAARIAYVFTDPNCPIATSSGAMPGHWCKLASCSCAIFWWACCAPAAKARPPPFWPPAPEQALASHAMAYADAHGKNPDVLGIAPLQRIPVGPRCTSQQRRADEQCRPACHTRDDLEECPGAGADPHRHAARAAGRVDGQSSRQVASTLGFKSPHSPCTEFASGYHRASKSAPTP
jgi:hypothetical protein